MPVHCWCPMYNECAGRNLVMKSTSLINAFAMEGENSSRNRLKMSLSECQGFRFCGWWHKNLARCPRCREQVPGIPPVSTSIVYQIHLNSHVGLINRVARPLLIRLVGSQTPYRTLITKYSHHDSSSLVTQTHAMLSKISPPHPKKTDQQTHCYDNHR